MRFRTGAYSQFFFVRSGIAAVGVGKQFLSWQAQGQGIIDYFLHTFTVINNYGEEEIMAKLIKRPRFNTKQTETAGMPMLVIKGVLVSLVISVVLTVLLSIFSLMAENVYVDNYLHYIMVAITIVSIFAGSAYATQKAGARGLLIGASVGIVYVLVSIGLGMEINNETISVMVLANKFVAGVAVGALGGLVGVNL
jgi:putative membrane protein (TIGR04086 family)